MTIQDFKNKCLSISRDKELLENLLDPNSTLFKKNKWVLLAEGNINCSFNYEPTGRFFSIDMSLPDGSFIIGVHYYAVIIRALGLTPTRILTEVFEAFDNINKNSNDKP